MSAVNNIHIVGRLGKDPEMKYAPSGTAYTKVSIAVDNRRNGNDDQPDWFNVVAFGKTAEFLNQYGAKGRLVAVNGEMHQNWSTEHRRVRPVLDKARELDIATNPAPDALFEAGTAGFQIWCTPADHPAGWETIPMDTGAFAQPCAYVAAVYWGWEADRITHLVLSTDAYELADHCNLGRYSFHNRLEDLDWAQAKIRWLFKQAGVTLPPIHIEE